MKEFFSNLRMKMEWKFIKLLTDFLKNRKQRVILKGETSSWTEVNARASQSSLLGPLLFLTYINDLPDGLSSNVELFADGTFLFSVVYDIHSSISDLNKNSKTINGHFSRKGA